MTQRESAIVVCVPEADPVVARWRDRYDPAAAAGVPAHVTLLYPFVAPDALPEVDAELEKLFATIAPFDVAFNAIGRFGDQVLFLDPEPDAPFVDIARRLCARFGLLPYGGTIPLDEFRPHLTIVDGHPQIFSEVDEDVTLQLPIAVRVTEAALLVSDEEWRWSTLRSVPLGPLD